MIEILEAAIPTTVDDVVVTLCSATGMKDGRPMQLSDARKIYAQEIHGEHSTAIQLTTAAGLCAMVDLIALNRVFDRGFVRPEQVSLELFSKSRFGRYYVATPAEAASSPHPI